MIYVRFVFSFKHAADSALFGELDVRKLCYYFIYLYILSKKRYMNERHVEHLYPLGLFKR